MRQIKSPVDASKGRLKRPVAEVSADDQKPTFSLEYMVSGWCLRHCVKDERAAFSMALLERSGCTWRELRMAGRQGMGYEIIKKGAISAGIPSVVGEDVELIAFRFCGKAPMVGFRRGHTFFVLWLDRGFTLYDHG